MMKELPLMQLQNIVIELLARVAKHRRRLGLGLGRPYTVRRRFLSKVFIRKLISWGRPHLFTLLVPSDQTTILEKGKRSLCLRARATMAR